MKKEIKLDTCGCILEFEAGQEWPDLQLITPCEVHKNLPEAIRKSRVEKEHKAKNLILDEVMKHARSRPANYNWNLNGDTLTISLTIQNKERQLFEAQPEEMKPSLAAGIVARFAQGNLPLGQEFEYGYDQNRKLIVKLSGFTDEEKTELKTKGKKKVEDFDII